jgi:excisionase family DNA binding protein
MPDSFPEVMTIQETSQYLRIPLSSLYKLAQEGRIPCQKVGRHWRFRRMAIERWLEQMPPENETRGDGRTANQED